MSQRKRRVHTSPVQIRGWTVDVVFWPNISREVNIGRANETEVMFPILDTYIHLHVWSHVINYLLMCRGSVPCRGVLRTLCLCVSHFVSCPVIKQRQSDQPSASIARSLIRTSHEYLASIAKFHVFLSLLFCFQ